MGARFETLYLVREGDDLDPDFFNKRFRDVDDRIEPLEIARKSEDEAFAVVLDRVLGRSEGVIGELRDRLLAITQLGWLIARSTTAIDLVAGENRRIWVREQDRDLFAPGPFGVLSRLSTADDFAIFRTIAFDRESGALDLEVVTATGAAGPFDDWEVAAVAGSTLAQLSFLNEGQAARDTAVEKSDLAVAAADAAVPAAAQAVAARDEAVPAAAAAVAARDVAVAAAAAVDAPAIHARIDGVELDLAAEVGDRQAAVAGVAADLATTQDDLDDVRLAAMMFTRQTVAAQLMAIVTTGTRVGFVQGMADAFNDSTGIDGATSSHWEVGAAGQRRGVAPVLDPVPRMTSNVLPAGNVATAKSGGGADENAAGAYMAWSEGSAWTTGNPAAGPFPYVLTRTFAAPFTPRRMTYGNGQAHSFTIEARLGGGAWVQLANRVNAASGSTTVLDMAGNNDSYDQVRVTITQSHFTNYNYTTFGPLKFDGPENPADHRWTLQSPTYAASVDLPVPDLAFLQVALANLGGCVVNQHVKAYVSRDGGANWAEATLVAVQAMADGSTLYEDPDVDLSAQPAGRSVKWRVVALPPDLVSNPAISAVALQWR